MNDVLKSLTINDQGGIHSGAVAQVSERLNPVVSVLASEPDYSTGKTDVRLAKCRYRIRISVEGDSRFAG